jgi:hypothetical protein
LTYAPLSTENWCTVPRSSALKLAIGTNAQSSL